MNLPEYPETINSWLVEKLKVYLAGMLNYAVNKSAPEVLVKTKEIAGEIDKLQKCEFHSAWVGKCGAIAVTQCVGMICCEEHAKERYRYFY